MEQVKYPGSIKQWEGEEPKLIIIASEQDIQEARPFVTDEALAAIRKMDFTAQFAVLAFRGLQPNSHSGFRVDRVVRQGDEVLLYAKPGTLGPLPMVSSPYHLISVKKEGNWDGNFTFHLFFNEDGTPSTPTTHYVP
jgi:hypothetical protein